ncbi:SGNH/GDSL hydrolase family protein [Akkermansiaceae bacterium]|jgi:lysophospholipase L1-like esterase|nr:SGNH/GDSL hydrolase family protein [Akkermansiaceae bacterium]MDA7868379.1 SGNH/GDSL hydrolase family protein [bacterium]MDA7907694.1 SGNH/GDSL hydrolase family protein [Akkermansiaceae bacterium]MDA7934273.1 SGNH/GDSL hydrolase family protein [Akkermansiaceae bacterium]MDA9831210.1 SGNH/GDSL hydrolase family protein [Akkermansiaceae bacterium]
MKKFWLSLLSITLPASAVTFEDNDTVVLLGNTVIERAQKYGYFETAISLSAGKNNLKFRNLGWSGDTVFGTARSYFGPPKEGFDRLKSDLTELKPNVVIVCYGAVAAFDGEKGLPEFISGYETLLSMIKSSAAPREIVIVSPPPAESLGAPMPDMAEHNKRLALYSEALGDLAAKHKLRFADFFTTLGSSKGLTDNGLHFTSEGYQTASPKFVEALGINLATGNQLQSEHARKLREATVAKNKLFFFRWRPANETYLRLFRKHEQGNNVRELPMFDPLIAEAEKEIEALKKTTLSLK